MKEHYVLLEDGTTGMIQDSSIDYQDPENFIGETMNVHLHDENGNPIEKEGKLVSVEYTTEY